jgi:NAD(P)H-dependent flavin oxidoreductase YrpB (nitropropane dioxygenase family)
MKIHTRVCDLLGIEIPIVQAPIGPAATAELAAAVSNAGGLGQIAGSTLDLDSLRARLRQARELTNKPLAVNFILEFPLDDALAVCLDEGVRIFSLFWGVSGKVNERIKKAGGTVLQVVGSAADARLAADSGADILVAQGVEAGGHVWGQVSSLVLIPIVADAVPALPVIAAGGIADGRGLAAALALGASGAWLGTRFLLSHEAGAHQRYKAALIAARETDTIYSTLFDVGWPGAPARSLVNDTVRAWQAAGSPPSGARPGEGETIAWNGQTPLPRYFVDIPWATTTGAVDEMCMYAGQGVGLISTVQPAGEIVRDLVEEAQAALRRSGQHFVADA